MHMTTTTPAQKSPQENPEQKPARFEDLREPRRIPPARLRTVEEARLAVEIDKLIG
jgi:hypothetical protein